MPVLKKDGENCGWRAVMKARGIVDRAGNNGRDCGSGSAMNCGKFQIKRDYLFTP